MFVDIKEIFNQGRKCHKRVSLLKRWNVSHIRNFTVCSPRNLDSHFPYPFSRLHTHDTMRNIFQREKQQQQSLFNHPRFLFFNKTFSCSIKIEVFKLHFDISGHPQPSLISRNLSTHFPLNQDHSYQMQCLNRISSRETFVDFGRGSNPTTIQAMPRFQFVIRMNRSFLQIKKPLAKEKKNEANKKKMPMGGSFSQHIFQLISGSRQLRCSQSEEGFMQETSAS